jgi:hypothetical protein
VRLNKSVEEIILSSHKREHWTRRLDEREWWIEIPKQKVRPKVVKWFEDDHVDIELYSCLVTLNQKGIHTEYSCAGVSLLDDPVDHSLYAYVTLPEGEITTAFVDYAIKSMRHRVLVTFDPKRKRYDLSSFFIKHNRSFCMLLNHYAKTFNDNSKHTNTLGFC